MIALENVSHFVPGTGRKRAILRNCTLTIQTSDRVGILAAAGSGKSSLARVFSGIDRPDQGRIRLECRVSWPLGFSGFLHPHLSPRVNIRTLSRLTGQSAERLIRIYSLFESREAKLDCRMIDLSPTERAALGYILSMATPFDMLVVDEQLTVGEAPQRKKCEALLVDRLRHAGLLFISRNPRQLEAHCDRHFVLLNQKLVPVSDLEAAREALDESLDSSMEEEFLEYAG